ncbi:TPA: hypothetical protein ACP5S6_004572 [Vibrio parahaemolyticus]
MKDKSKEIKDALRLKVITNEKLKGELSVYECALAIYLNGWSPFDAQAEMDLREKHEQEFLGYIAFEFDTIFTNVLSACIDLSLPVQSSYRAGERSLHVRELYIAIDDFVDWLLKTEFCGKNLVPSSLAVECSYSELFQFYDENDAINNIEGSDIMKPTRELALYIGELDKDPAKSEAMLRKENSELKRDISRLKKDTEKRDSIINGQLPRESMMLTFISRVTELLLFGGTKGKGLFHTEEEIIDEIEILNEDRVNKISKRTSQSILSKSKTRQV